MLIQALIGRFVRNVKAEMETYFRKLKAINFNSFDELIKPKTKNLLTNAILAPYEANEAKVIIGLCNLLGTYCNLESTKETEVKNTVTDVLDGVLEAIETENSTDAGIEMIVEDIISSIIISIEEGNQYLNFSISRDSSSSINLVEELKE